MEKRLKAWVKELKRVFGNNLACVILYGSAARGDYIRSRSDLNLMLVFKMIDLKDITKVGKLMSWKIWRHAPKLVFWTEEELENAWDVFPLEFEDIVENHQCLLGKDIFDTGKVDTRHTRYQIEFELRSKLLALRDNWLKFNRDRGALEMFLIKAGSSFEYLIRKAEAAFPKKIIIPSNVFEKIKKLKKREIRMGRSDLQQLCHRLHETVESVIRIIEAN